MRIQYYNVENFKMLKNVTIEPGFDSAIIRIAGKNEQGKSSVLDGFYAAIQSAKALKNTPEPIRHGQEKAYSEIRFGDTISGAYTIRRSWKAGDSKVGRLSITPDPGVPHQEWLNSLISDIGLNLSLFIDSSDKEQTEILLSSFDIKVDDLIEKDAQLRDTRKDNTKEIRRNTSLLENYNGVKPTERVDISSLIEEKNEANNNNQARENLRQKGIEFNNKISNKENLISDYQKQIDSLKNQIEALEYKIDAENESIEDLKIKRSEIGSEFRLIKKIDTSAIDEKIKNADETNQQYQKYQTKLKIEKDLEVLKNNDIEYTKQIDDVAAEKSKRLSKASSFVPGLSIDDNRLIRVNGILFTQLSTSQRIKFAIKIVEAQNKPFRVILVKRASELDEDSQKLLEDFAREKDYQLLFELVGTSHDDAIIIEDGQIK